LAKYWQSPNGHEGITVVTACSVVFEL
jgi:hypothetical protein